MAVAVEEAEEFKMSKAVIDRKRGDDYQVIKLVKGLDIRSRSYKEILESLGGIVSEMPAAGGPAIRVVGGKSDGKTFVGVLISVEGYNPYMPKNMHISKDDHYATHDLIRFAIPPEPIRKEIAERLGRA